MLGLWENINDVGFVDLIFVLEIIIHNVCFKIMCSFSFENIK